MHVASTEKENIADQAPASQQKTDAEKFNIKKKYTHDALIVNTKVYAAADKYDVPELKELAHRKVLDRLESDAWPFYNFHNGKCSRSKFPLSHRFVKLEDLSLDLSISWAGMVQFRNCWYMSFALKQTKTSTLALTEGCPVFGTKHKSVICMEILTHSLCSKSGNRPEESAKAMGQGQALLLSFCLEMD